MAVNIYDDKVDGEKIDYNWWNAVQKALGAIPTVGAYPSIAADFVVFKVGLTYYARNGLTGEVLYGDLDGKNTIQDSLDNITDVGRVVVKDQVEVDSGITVPAKRTLQIDGEIIPTAAFAAGGGIVVSLDTNYSNLIGTGRINCLDYTNPLVAVQTVGSGIFRTVKDITILNAEIAVLIHAANLVNYEGRLAGVKTYECGTGFKFDGLQAHDWVLNSCFAWNTRTYGVDIADIEVEMIRMFGGGCHGYAGFIPIHTHGFQSSFYNVWTETTTGNTFDYEVEADAERTLIHSPRWVGKKIMNLGRDTHIVWPVLTSVKALIDQFLFLPYWTSTVVGTGVVSAVYSGAATGRRICDLSTGAGMGGEASIYSEQLTKIVGHPLPHMEVIAALSILTNQNVMIEWWYNDNNRAGFEYDPIVSPNWYARTVKAGAETVADTGIAADTDYHNFRVVLTLTTQAKFLIDDALVQTINTDVPSDFPLGVRYWIINTAAETKHLYLSSQQYFCRHTA